MIATVTQKRTPFYQVEPGKTQPLGATPDADGVNFSLYSAHATAVELFIFEQPEDPDPIQVIPLDPSVNRTFYYWHVYVKGLRPGAAYAYRFLYLFSRTPPTRIAARSCIS